MTATTTTRSDYGPDPFGERLVWKSIKSDAILNNGKPMFAAEALEYAKANAKNAKDFAELAEDRVAWTSGFGVRCTYVGTLPVPDDPHAAVQSLLLDLPLSVQQGDLLVQALTAAADSDTPDHPVVAPLLQLLAMAPTL